MRLFLTLKASGLKPQKETFKKLKVSLDKKEILHKWVDPDEWHIPLGGLGEMGRESWLEFAPQVRRLAQREPFNLHLDSLQAYPESAKARLIWISSNYPKELQRLHTEAAAFLTADEHTWRPLIPIVRLKNHKNVTDPLSPYKTTDFGDLLIDTFQVIDMVAGGPYPVYKLVEEITFSGSQPSDDSSPS